MTEKHESIIRRSPQPASQFSGFRRHTRRALETHLILQDESGWEIPLDAVDLSATGMYVASPALFEVGSEHVLHFKDEGGKTFRVKARVVRVSDETSDVRIQPNEPALPGMGYEFVDVDNQTWEALCESVSAV